MARLVGILLMACLFLVAAPLMAGAQAGSPERDAAMCERAVLNGARRGGVPEAVLHAISLTETGRNLGGKLRPWPWAINREGQGYWFGTREEALAFAKASLAEGRRSFDIGCFQINYHWHGHNFASLEAMFDQDTGADYAARFLRGLHGELGTWTAAAGAYHSRTPEFANRYRARFDRLLAGLGGAPLVVAEAEEGPAVARGKSRTRMSAKPKVITVSGPRPPEDPLAAKIATIRVERGKVPRKVLEAEAAAGTEAVAAERDTPL